jgi:tape measure domain-containing protein
MAEQIISNYGIKFGFVVDQNSVKTIYAQIDNIKKRIEKQLNTTLRINKIVYGEGVFGAKSLLGRKLNQTVHVDKIVISNDALASARKRLASGLKGAASDAFSSIVLPIDKFKVNAVELRKQVQAAFSQGVVLKVDATQNATPQRTIASSPTTTPRRGFLSIGQSSLGYGLLGGMTGVVPAFAATTGIMGLNRISEDLQTGQVALGTVTKGRGKEAFDWLRATGREIGIDYRSQLPVFSNYVASSINKQGYEGSLQSFKDISLFGMTHGATGQSMERAMLALGQMWSKGKVMAEELNNQLSEARGFGGAKEIFAEAYQIKTGGGLIGQKAEAALIKAMKEGKVLSADILPIVAQLMRERAGQGLSEYQKTTQFQRNQMRNAFSDAVLAFGRGGFDRGMSRIFEKIATSIDSLVKSGTVAKLGQSFNLVGVALGGILEESSRIINFFTDLTGNLGQAGIFALALHKIIGRPGSIFAALLLVLEDLDVYVSGGDSVIGKFISYMKDLTGMDWNAIAVGIGAVGIAITAAFSPITALAASIGALIAAFKYLEELKAKEKQINPNATRLPTTSEMNAQYLRNAEQAWDKNPSYSTWSDMVNAKINVTAAGIGIPGIDVFKWDKIAADDKRKPYKSIVDRLQSGRNAGWLQEDEFNRARAALGSGMSTPAAIESWLNTRQSNNNPFWKNEDTLAKYTFTGPISVIADNPTQFLDYFEVMTQTAIANHQTGEGTRSK